jgi:ubiquinone/menaquinone biosynthesis C-methylase UbiE
MHSTPPVCDYEGSDYQHAFWGRGERAYEDGAEAVALRRLLPKGGRLLLELGAGAGRNTPRYAGFERVVLLDYSMTQLQQAQSHLGRSERYIFVAANAYQLPFLPQTFDAATMIRTLHHIADAPAVLKQVRRVLQGQGVFILEYASKHNLKAIMRYLLHRQSWSPFSPEPVEFVKLNFDFHPATIRRWLVEAGFERQRQLTVSHFRVGWLKRLLPTSLLVGMDSLAQLTGDLWQLTPSVFVRSRAIGAAPQVSTGRFFACPACGQGPLDETPDRCACTGCSRTWLIEDGIYNFKV